MAYINKETSKQIREALKPIGVKYGVKFSVTIKDYSSLNVAIISGNLNLRNDMIVNKRGLR